jgi:hypothetical protein
MDCLSAKQLGRAWLVTAVLAVGMGGAHAQKGMLEIHGVITSPGCQLSRQSLQQLGETARLSGQACGLSTGSGNPLSSATIAQVALETLAPAHNARASQRLMTLNYR